MDLSEIANLYVTSIGKIEFYWNFYTVTLIAIVGWVVSAKRTFTLPTKSAIAVAYSAFVMMNIVGLRKSYALAEALRLDLLELEDARALEATHTVLSGMSLAKMPAVTLLIHAVLGAALLTLIWFQHVEEDSDKDDATAGG